ncbi:MAG: 3-hydroxyacyl-CoA dehydrogenase NAD-binding domain-containing protein [Desulfobacterales bacterium]|nr:3-hydroxyacyl-CoA dehydrogenase NAD-binding domain-containing protein [Desulfobacterales bacterium]
MNISRVACIGAGLIGQGWATVFSIRCSSVILQDTSESLLQEGLNQVGRHLSFLASHDLLDRGEADRAFERIHTTTAIEEAVSDASYVQESVPDNYEIKKIVFADMDRFAPADAVLASSASGLLMTEIQKVVSRPERCVLVHPMLPVHLLPCVEIAGGRKTSPETVALAKRFMEYLGKAPVVLKVEVPGYIVNRLQAALLRESLDLVEKGVASAEDVDKAFRTGIGLRDPILGPFLRIHLAGNGVENFFRTLGDSYRVRWESMVNWTAIPSSTAASACKAVRQMRVIRDKTIEEIASWRDEMLVKILKAVGKE